MLSSHHTQVIVLRRFAASVWLVPILCALIAFVVYASTLQPGLSGGDSAEAQFVPYSFSIMHYTGYPLYTVLGYVWSHLVVLGDVAYRMNLLSAVAGAAAVGLMVYLGRSLSRETWIGVLAAAFMGGSTLIWDWSTKAGVRSLNVAFVVAIFALALFWGEGQKNTTVAVNRRWAALWLVVGLSLAHHRTSILILPGVLIYVLWTRPRLLLDRRAILSAALALVPGLAFYLYLPISSAFSPAYQPLPIDSLNHFLDLVLARNLSDMVTSLTLAQVPERLGWFVDYLVTQLGVVGLGTAAAGLVWMLFRRTKPAVMLWISLLLLTAFTINYEIQGMLRLNIVFLMPVNAIASLGSAYCIVTILRGLTALGIRLVHMAKPVITNQICGGASALVGIAILVPMITASLALVRPVNEPAMNAYREELRGGQAVRLTTYPAASEEPGVVVVGEWEHIAAFMYQKIIDQRWPAAEFRYPVDAQLGSYIEEAWSQGRDIYLTRAVPGLGDGRQLSMDGPLIHVMRQPDRQIPVTAIRTHVVYSDGVMLVGFIAYTQTFHSGGVLPVTLYWQAQQVIQHDYSISLRLLDGQGKQAAQEDAEQPVLGSFPMTHWQAGSVVGDYYELRLPENLKPGSFALAVVLYERLPDGTTYNLPNKADGQSLTVFGHLGR